MYIERVPNRKSPPAVLLRESFREGGKIRKRTIANLSGLPDGIIDGFRDVLKGQAVSKTQAIIDPEKSLILDDSRQHGAVAAVLGTIRKTGLDHLLGSRRCKERDIVIAMIADRLLHGDSKLVTARHCSEQTGVTTLGPELGLTDIDEQDCYAAMDWLLERQGAIEARLAAKHLQSGDPLLYDLSSSYFEGHTCPLARFGYSRDHRGDLPQINYGLYCSAMGVPIAVDVLAGNQGDRVAFPQAVRRARSEFGMESVIFVGDRGMIGGKVINDILRGEEGAEWITALANPTIARLADEGAIQLSIFDEQNLATITHPDFPDERLIACRNPLLAAERRRKRSELLEATDCKLQKIKERVGREKRPLRGTGRIGIEIGKVIGKKKMAKHYDLDIKDDSFTYTRNQERIDAEAALDGIYVIRTSVSEKQMSSREAVAQYKQLAAVERAFRSFKAFDIGVRPIHHRLEARVKSHIFICMLAYYVEHAMRAALAPALFHDEDKPESVDIVTPAQRSEAALRKDADRINADGWPVSSYRDVLNCLAGITRSRASFKGHRDHKFTTTSRPSTYQKYLLSLLNVAV